MTPEQRRVRARRSVVVRLTPRQAIECAAVLESQAFARQQGRLFSGSSAIHTALMVAGWEWDDGTESWTHPTGGTVSDRFET